MKPLKTRGQPSRPARAHQAVMAQNGGQTIRTQSVQYADNPKLAKLETRSILRDRFHAYKIVCNEVFVRSMQFRFIKGPHFAWRQLTQRGDLS